MNVVIAVSDILIGNQVLEKREGGFHTIHYELVQRTAQTHHAFDAIATMHDELADKAVVVRRNAIAGIDTRIHADAEATRRMIMRDQARRRRKSQRVFSVDTAFDGMAGEADILLLYRGQLQRESVRERDRYPLWLP